MKRWHLGSLIMLLVSILAACGRSESPSLLQADAPTVVQPDGSALLQLKLQQGQTYRTAMTIEQTVEQSLRGSVQRTTSTTQLTMTHTVSQVDADGTIHIDAAYEHVVIEQANPTSTLRSKTFRYNSATFKPNRYTSQQPRMYHQIIGQKVSIQVAPNGEIKNVTGFDAIIDSMTFNPKDPPGDSFRELMTVLFEQPLIGTNGSLTRFSDQPISVGQSWSQKTSRLTNFADLVINFTYSATLDTTYTLTERQDGIATIAIEGVGALYGDDEKLIIDMPGDQIGTLSIDEATGWVLRSEIQQTYAGAFGLDTSVNPTGMTFPMTTTTVIRTTSKP